MAPSHPKGIHHKGTKDTKRKQKQETGKAGPDSLGGRAGCLPRISCFPFLLVALLCVLCAFVVNPLPHPRFMLRRNSAFDLVLRRRLVSSSIASTGCMSAS